MNSPIVQAFIIVMVLLVIIVAIAFIVAQCTFSGNAFNPQLLLSL